MASFNTNQTTIKLIKTSNNHLKQQQHKLAPIAAVIWTRRTRSMALRPRQHQQGDLDAQLKTM